LKKVTTFENVKKKVVTSFNRGKNTKSNNLTTFLLLNLYTYVYIDKDIKKPVNRLLLAIFLLLDHVTTFVTGFSKSRYFLDITGGIIF